MKKLKYSYIIGVLSSDGTLTISKEGYDNIDKAINFIEKRIDGKNYKKFGLRWDNQDPELKDRTQAFLIYPIQIR